VPFFVNSNVAFVQTPQTYGNLINMVSRGAGYMQAVFYKFIQPGRNHFNAGVLRRHQRDLPPLRDQ
jgi:cellulose synthase (UDP-forming)